MLLNMRLPLTEEVTMTDPPRMVRSGRASLMVRKVPRRLMRMVSSHSSMVSFSSGDQTPLMPALAKTMSRRRHLRRTFSITVSICRASPTSAVTANASPPALVIF